MRVLSVSALAGALLTVGDAKMCLMTSFDGEVTKSHLCKNDTDCCGAARCQISDGACHSDSGLSAAHSAAVAHLVVQQTVQEAMLVGAYLDNAAEGIAFASDKLAAIKDKNIMDGLKKNARDKVTGAVNTVRNKLKGTNVKAKTVMSKADSPPPLDAKTFKAKGDDALDKIKRKFDEIMANITTKSTNNAKVVAKDATGADSYSTFYGKGTSFPKSPKMKAGAKLVNSAADTASPAAFDYKNFLPGVTAGKDTKKTNSTATDGSPNNSPAGFDWNKFIPGAKFDNNKTTDKKTNVAVAASDAPKGGSPSGFDYTTFMTRLANNAVGGALGGGIDWERNVPLSNGTSSFGSKNLVNSAGAAAPANPRKESAALPSEPASGTEGAPCGTTSYKDFGKCNAKLTCERQSLFTSFAPGKCVKKVAKGGAKPVVSNTAADNGKITKITTPMAGAAGGPCGKWTLGGMDFGACKEDLTCLPTKDPSLTFKGKTFTLPNTCQNLTDTTATASANLDTSVTLIGDGDGDSDGDGEDVSDTDKPLDADAVKAAAAEVADKANEAALKAADAAEVIANKLLAAAAQVRDAAAKLKQEANNLTTTSTVSGAESEAMLANYSSGNSHLMLFSLSVLAIGGVGYVWKSRKTHDYRRV